MSSGCRLVLYKGSISVLYKGSRSLLYKGSTRLYRLSDGLGEKFLSGSGGSEGIYETSGHQFGVSGISGFRICLGFGFRARVYRVWV